MEIKTESWQDPFRRSAKHDTAVSEILEWPKVLEHLESCCQTGYGRLQVDAEALKLPTREAIALEMQQVEEAKVLIQRYGDISLSTVPDIRSLMQRLQKQGEVQSLEELGEGLKALKGMRQLVRYLVQNSSKEETPLLEKRLDEVTLPNPAIELLEHWITDSGELRLSASPTYAQLNTRQQEVQRQIKQTLQNMISRPQMAKYLQEAIVTEREGRSVLPVKVEHRTEIKGIIHGTSATGGTLYIEPQAVTELNNKRVQLQSELEKELRRILKTISELLYPMMADLQDFLDQAAQLDLLMAKARQSLIFHANPVELIDQPGHLALKQARHPLLILQQIAVVPNDVVMAPPQKVLLITGPNTGGKTVLLKLVGLFALMLQCGLHLPVKEGSAMSLFHPVLADIGDPQSIAQNLSTFSGHITRLNAFLHEPDLSQAVILVDEICAGTDPQEGAALAQALLEAFYQRGATVIVTTHIGELKVVAHQHEGYLNASVEFDPETLSPTYRLILGVPGTSNALNIAARLGVSANIVDFAREKLSQPASDSAQLIESLEAKNRQLAAELEEAQRLREEMQWEEGQIRKQLDTIEGEKKKTLQLFRDSLRSKLRSVEQEVDDLKQALREESTSPDVQTLSGRFRKAQSQAGEIFTEESQKLYRINQLQWDQIQVGDVVESRSLNLSGTVIEKHPARQELTIQSGILKTTIPLSDIIQKVGKSEPKKRKKAPNTGRGGKVHLETPRSYALDCDVRGMTSDEAIGIVDKFLDDALVTGATMVHVIHGLGTGQLKKAIRSYLKELTYIKSFGPAPANEGGDGKTIIHL